MELLLDDGEETRNKWGDKDSKLDYVFNITKILKKLVKYHIASLLVS